MEAAIFIRICDSWRGKGDGYNLPVKK